MRRIVEELRLLWVQKLLFWSVRIAPLERTEGKIVAVGVLQILERVCEHDQVQKNR